MTGTPSGTGPLEVTLRILSSSTITTAFEMTVWPSQSLPNRMALVAAPAFRQTASVTTRRTLTVRSMLVDRMIRLQVLSQKLVDIVPGLLGQLGIKPPELVSARRV